MDPSISPIQANTDQPVAALNEPRAIPDSGITGEPSPEAQEAILEEALTESLSSIAVGFLGLVIGEGNNQVQQHNRRTQEAMQEMEK